MKRLAIVFLCVIAAAIGFSAEVSNLVHRWSFNGDLTDSVGGQTAKVVGSATSNGKQYTLPGGSYGSSYIDLGSDILPKTSKTVTIEIWATQISIQSYSRIFSFGGSGGNLYMEWTLSSSLNCDEVWFGGKNFSGFQSRLAPYSLGTEYHISVVMTEGNDGVWTAKYYKKNIQTGGTLATYTARGSDTWSLENQDLSKCYLGQAVNGSSENTANASYNEVRIWSRALTEDELTASAKAGPDALPDQSSFRIKFDANGGTPAPSDITRDAGAEYGELPTVTRTGYAFDGWYTAVTGGTKVTATTKVTGDVTLYAHWVSSPSGEGNVSVTSATAQQRYPVDGLVDITVTIQGAADDVAEAECLFVATNGATKAAIPVVHITRNGDDTGSGNTWTRKFIWDAKADVGAVKIDDGALTVAIKGTTSVEGGVQLWENGPYWADCNVGATKPEEVGYYFWWGDTVGYKRNANNDGWVSVKDSKSFLFNVGNCPTHGKNNSQLQSARYIDSTSNLIAAHDAATVHLGAPWRMPTDAEFSALISNCMSTWTTLNGVKGRLVKGKGAYSSKSIFLPAAAYGVDSYHYDLGSNGSYWSSTPNSDNSGCAGTLFFGSGEFALYDICGRFGGQSVRPVRGFSRPSVAIGGVTTHFVVNCREVTISFNAQGGSPTPLSTTLYEGSEYGELPTVTRTGYTFDGWYTAATGGTKVTATTKATGDATLYAHWTAVKYAITYNLDGGSNASSNPATYTVEDAVTLAVPTRSGYTFFGWTPDNGKIARGSTGAKTFTATWTKNVVVKYTISFNANGGSSAPAAITRDEGSEYGELPTVTRTGYTFDGWYTAATGGTKVAATTKATGSVTLYAHWTAIKYNVLTFDTAGKVPSPEPISRRDEENLGELPIVTCPGFAFTGWYTAAYGGTRVLADTKASEDTTLYAHWAELSFKYSYKNAEEVIVTGLYNADAASGYIEIPSSHNGYRVVGISDGAFGYCDKLVGVKIPSGVISIGVAAFSWCSKLDWVVLPQTLTNIDDQAFEWCQGLRRIELPDSLTQVGSYLFSYCTELEDVVLPSGLEELPSGIFEHCESLKSVSLPRSVTSIGDNAFYECTALSSIEFPDGLATIGAHAFYDCGGLESLSIPLSVIDIGASAFECCDGLGAGIVLIDGCVLGVNGECPEEVSLPEDTRLIAGGAFYYCYNLKSVRLPASVAIIGSNAFGNCQRLTSMVVDSGNACFYSDSGLLYDKVNMSLIYCPMGKEGCVTISSDVVRIGDYAFSGCAKMTSLVLPEGVVSIGEDAFSDCSALISVAIPSSVKSIGSGAFYGCSALRAIDIPTGVTNIGSSTFSGCIELTSVLLSNGLQKIGSGAFSDCAKITKMELPASVTSIGYSAFEDCSGMVSISIPRGVMEIGYHAFWRCMGLKTIYVGIGDTDRIRGLISESGGISGFPRPVSMEYVEVEEANEYVVTFDANGGSSQPAARARKAGENYGALPLVTRAGYAFDGWYTAADGGSRVFAEQEVTGDVTLTAQWTPVPEGAKFAAVLNDDDTVTLMQYTGDSIPEVLVIPSELGGRRVTGVGLLRLQTREEKKYDGVSFFGENEDESIVIGSKLKSVKLSEGIETIGINSPFAYQSGIMSVEFPSTLKNVGDWAFCCCTGLKSVDLSGTALRNCLWSSFAGCTSLTDVKFPSTVTTLGGISFAWCRALKSVTFMGDAPAIQNAASDGGDGAKWGDWAGRIYVDSGFDFKSFDTQRSNPKYLTGIVTYVRPDSKGWGTVPGNWQGNSIVYMKEDPIPELPPSASEDEVRVALEGSADAKLQENITDAAVYGQYREWAMKIGAESVKGAANSWISFAVDSAALLEKVPVDSDLKIEEFKPALAEGVFDFTVSVKDVTVGSEATDANLKKVFGLGGTTQLGTEEFDSDKVALEFGTPVNGKLKFTASPKDKTAKSFFMKMKVK